MSQLPHTIKLSTNHLEVVLQSLLEQKENILSELEEITELIEKIQDYKDSHVDEDK